MYWQSRYLKNWDIWLTALVLVLVGAGLVVLSSAVTGFDPQGAGGYIVRQVAAICMGLASWLVLAIFDYGDYRSMYGFLYGANIAALVAVLLFGVELNGAKAWIDLKFFMVQPAELSKVLLIITLGHLLVSQERLQGWLDLGKPILHVLPVLGLVLLQNDLGTALVIVAISVVMVYAAGFPGQKILAVSLAGLLLIGGMVFSHYRWGTNFPLQKHHWERIDTYLYPDKDVADRGWQLLQSKVAIGSGGVWGKGFGQGTQTRLGFLPFQHTDFIFAVAAEEYGFVGGIGILVLYALLLFRIGGVAQQARDTYGTLIALGVAALIGAHVLENIGMTMGVTPVTGIPLPFISYGPTALLANLMAIGLVQSVAVHRDPIVF